MTFDPRLIGQGLEQAVLEEIELHAANGAHVFMLQYISLQI
jgi:hypothetical protein